MKKTIIIATVLVLGSVGAILAFAQISHKAGPMQHFSRMTDHHEKMIEHLSTELKLNDQQKVQLKQVIADAKPRFTTIHGQLLETHRASRDLGTNGVFDEKSAAEVANGQAEIIKRGLIEKERTKAAIFAILTTEQREKAKRLLDTLIEGFGH